MKMRLSTERVVPVTPFSKHLSLEAFTLFYLAQSMCQRRVEPVINVSKCLRSNMCHG